MTRSHLVLLLAQLFLIGLVYTGDMNIIKELKLANDNLKWRLEQRNKTLRASKLVIESLKARLQKAEEELAAERGSILLASDN